MISVIMSTYKEPVEYIHYSVQSILNQTYTDFEFIIVVDDPENAPVIAALEEYAAKDGRIRLLKNQQNLGLVASLNKALTVAKGEYIARMDADDYSVPDRFEKQLRFMEETGADLVGSRFYFFYDSSDELVPTAYYRPQILPFWLNRICALGHTGWLVKRAVYDTLKGYRDIPRCEDHDLLLRAKKAGFSLLQQNDFLFYYRANPNGISRSAALQQYLTVRYLTKNRRCLEKVTRENIERQVLSRLTPDTIKRHAAVIQQISNIQPLKRTNRFAWLLKRLRLEFSSKYVFTIHLRSIYLRILMKITGVDIT